MCFRTTFLSPKEISSSSPSFVQTRVLLHGLCGSIWRHLPRYCYFCTPRINIIRYIYQIDIFHFLKCVPNTLSKNCIAVAVETLDALLILLLLLNFFEGGGVHEVVLFHSGLKKIYIK
jgi:hypothetical protein